MMLKEHKQLRQRNRASLPVSADSLDAVLLTHAHLDHSGYLPVLVNAGFGGRVLATHATRALCTHLLRDAGFIQEKDAEFANRHGFSKHHPALPLYTQADAERCMHAFRTVAFHDTVEPVAGLQACWTRAGHILGAASITVRVADRSIVFSGDLGNRNSATMAPPEPIPEADFVVVESTYGDRSRNHADPEEALAEVIQRTAARGGADASDALRLAIEERFGWTVTVPAHGETQALE